MAGVDGEGAPGGGGVHRFIGCVFDVVEIGGKGREISPLAVDLTYHTIGWGVGWRTSGWAVDLGFVYTVFEERRTSRGEFPGRYGGWDFIPGIRVSHRS